MKKVLLYAMVTIAFVACKSKNDPSDPGSIDGLRTVYDLVPMYQKSLNEAKKIPLSWGMTLRRESMTEAYFDDGYGDCFLSASNNYVDEIETLQPLEGLSNPMQSFINWIKYHGSVIDVNNQKYYFYGPYDGPIAFDEFLNMLDQMKHQGLVGADVMYLTKEDASYFETHGTLPKQTFKIILYGGADEKDGEVMIEFGSVPISDTNN